MKVITFVGLSFIEKHQLVSTLTLPVFPLFRIRLGQLKLFFTVLSKLVVLGTFFDQEKRKIKNLLMKNLHPSCLMDKEIKTFLVKKITTKENTNIDHNNKSVSYRKLPYIRSYSTVRRKKCMSYAKHFAKRPMLELFFDHSNCRTYFLQKIVCQLL